MLHHISTLIGCFFTSSEVAEAGRWLKKRRKYTADRRTSLPWRHIEPHYSCSGASGRAWSFFWRYTFNWNCCSRGRLGISLWSKNNNVIFHYIRPLACNHYIDDVIVGAIYWTGTRQIFLFSITNKLHKLCQTRG